MSSQAAYEKKIKITESSSGAYQTLLTTGAQFSFEGTILDDTEHKNNAGYHSRIYGLRDWGISGTMIYDGADAAFEAVIDAWIGKTTLDVQYLPDGVAGSPGSGFEGTILVESLNLSGDVDGLETADFSFVADGAVARAS